MIEPRYRLLACDPGAAQSRFSAFADTQLEVIDRVAGIKIDPECCHLDVRIEDTITGHMVTVRNFKEIWRAVGIRPQ